MPASEQASSLSPPGAPETPMTPIGVVVFQSSDTAVLREFRD